MTEFDHARLVDALLPAVLAAGRVEMGYYTSGVAVEQKSDDSPVTAADREAEAILVSALHAVAPGIPVIAEEGTAAGGAAAVGASFFLVDPLDGTREFIKKVGEFTINIGLVSDGVPVFGVVYAPALDTLYATIAPQEAVTARVTPGAAVHTLRDLALAPLRAREPDQARLVALESRSHRSPGTEEYLTRLGVTETRQSGSSLKFCLIAAGEADLYPRIGPTCEWDTAAGHAILNAAGGSVCTLDGAPLRYGKAGDRFLNPHFVAWGRRPVPMP